MACWGVLPRLAWDWEEAVTPGWAQGSGASDAEVAGYLYSVFSLIVGKLETELAVRRPRFKSCVGDQLYDLNLCSVLEYG